MPWWSWLVIWVVLIAALLALLVWQGIRLFRKALGVVTDLGELADKTSLLEQRAEQLAERRFEPAVFADASRLSQDRQRNKARRAEERAIHRDARVQRGRLLTKADYNQFSPPTKRT
jgi:hypothetical protein